MHFTICVRYWLVRKWTSHHFWTMDKRFSSRSSDSVGLMYSATVGNLSTIICDQISARMTLANLKFFFSKSASIVIPFSFKWLPQWSCGNINPVSSLLCGAIFISTLLKALLPGALVAINKASKSYRRKWWIATLITSWYLGFFVRTTINCKNENLFDDAINTTPCWRSSRPW